MGERTGYTPGTFSWVELSAADPAAAAQFYSSLFGWEITEHPAGAGPPYRIASLSGRDVAAITGQPSQQRDAGVPSMWNVYITVESAEAALSEARSLGGTVHAGPFDVFDQGRMGVVRDPQGAFFEVWEPRAHIGAAYVNAPGALSWNELASPDVDASAHFYECLFGWTREAIPDVEPPYVLVKTREDRINGGIRQAARTEPCYWLSYFGAEDIEASVSRAVELGGAQLVDPIDIAGGRIGVLQDPQGAVFALYAGQFDE